LAGAGLTELMSPAPETSPGEKAVMFAPPGDILVLIELMLKDNPFLMRTMCETFRMSDLEEKS
jgi:hypothetical protein